METRRMVQIEEWFSNRTLSKEQLERCSIIRTSAKNFAKILIANTDENSMDQTEALQKLRECVRTATDSIFCEGRTSMPKVISEKLRFSDKNTNRC